MPEALNELSVYLVNLFMPLAIGTNISALLTANRTILVHSFEGFWPFVFFLDVDWSWMGLYGTEWLFKAITMIKDFSLAAPSHTYQSLCSVSWPPVCKIAGVLKTLLKCGPVVLMHSFSPHKGSIAQRKDSKLSTISATTSYSLTKIFVMLYICVLFLYVFKNCIEDSVTLRGM